MADLSDINSAQAVKIIGSDTNGIEQDPVSSINGRLRVDATISPTNSFIGSVDIADGPNLDAFGRLRVSNPESLFESTFQFDAQPLLWSSSLSGDGAVTHNANTASVDFSVGTANGASVIYQTRQYFKYHPGKSQFVVFTGRLATPKANLRQRIGQFDEANGVFFQVNGTTLSAVVRSSVSGSVVETTANQADWNLDKLDGTGASGITLDTANQQIFLFDYQWLGSGRIRVGTIIGGRIVYAHEFNFANLITTPYSQTGTLPLRVEITNTGITASGSSGRLTCATIYSEGGFSPEGIARTGGSGVTLKTIGAAGKIPIVSIRKSASGIRIPVKIAGASVFCSTSDDLLITFTVNATLTGSTFATSIGFSQIDTAATTMSGGTEVYSFYLRGAAGIASEKLEDKFFELANLILGSTIAGVSDIFTISATSLSGAANAAAMINFRELS